MIVFKTVLKVINKRKGMLILYTAIFIAISLVNQTSTKPVTTFEETKPSISIINNDTKNDITDGFINYLSKHTYIKEIAEDKIDDAIFYHDISYILYIPENFSNDILKGNIPNINYKTNGDYNSSYTEMLIKKYISTISVYKNYYNNKELSDKVEEVKDKEIEVELATTLDVNTLNYATAFFNFLNYSFLAGCVYSVSMVLSSLKEKNVFKRTIISSYNYSKYTKSVLLANLLVIILMHALYMVIGVFLFKDIMFSTNGLLYIINSFIFIICSLAIGFLIGTITQNKNAIGGIVNVTALGTSFLCGCFVPIKYMPSYVVNISRILPTHYFVANNEIIKTLDKVDLNTIKPLLNNGIIIIIFTIAFIALTNIINNKKSKIA